MRHRSPPDQPAPSHNLEQEIRAYDRALAILSAVAATASTTLDVDEVLQRALALALEVVGVEAGAILVLDEATNELVFRAHQGWRVHDLVAQSVRVPADQGLFGTVTTTGQPTVTRNAGRDTRGTVPEFIDEGIQAMALAPMRAYDRVPGVLGVMSHEPREFSPEEITIVSAIADQIGIAYCHALLFIENAHLYQETERRLADVSALYQLAQQINTSLDVQEVMDSIVWSLRKTMDCRGCSIALLDPVDNVLEIRTAAGIESKWQRDFKLRLGEGIAGRVALEGTPICVPDVLELDGFIFFDPAVRSLLTVPLSIQQRVIGTLTVDSEQLGAFGEADEQLLTIAATQAAIAIENAQLYASLEQRAKNLAGAYAELKEADQLKDEIVQNVSHELRTPLTYMKSYVELLLDEDAEPLTAKQKEYIEIVVEKTNIVARLVSNITSLQQVDRGIGRKEPISLTRVARQSIQGYAATAAKIGLTLVENLPDDLPPVAGDEGRLVQVFNNLLDNAIKFSPNSGQILVVVEDVGTMVQASVSDQGIGIPKNQQEQVFERFYRVDGSAWRRSGGAELGLAIVKRIVETHEGQVWVESETGKGSTFYFTIPKYQD